MTTTNSVIRKLMSSHLRLSLDVDDGGTYSEYVQDLVHPND